MRLDKHKDDRHCHMQQADCKRAELLDAILPRGIERCESNHKEDLCHLARLNLDGAYFDPPLSTVDRLSHELDRDQSKHV